MNDDAGGNLDDKHREDDVVEDFQQPPIRCHDRLAGLQTEDDGVDDDERHDHALGARIVDDGT